MSTEIEVNRFEKYLSDTLLGDRNRTDENRFSKPNRNLNLNVLKIGTDIFKQNSFRFLRVLWGSDTQQYQWRI